MEEFKINISKNNYYNLDIKKVENHYNVSYIGDFQIKSGDNWTDFPVSIFYQPNPDFDKGHSNYLGIYKKVHFNFLTVEAISKVILCDGKYAFDEALTGVLCDNNEVIISCHRHDYKTSSCGKYFIDGGRNYLRTKRNPTYVKVAIKEDELYVIDSELVCRTCNQVIDDDDKIGQCWGCHIEENFSYTR